ncbi:MAG: D-alanyl-D-alanine carboxypeptidase [Treponema sp.]|jgi:D-alanyl-D-alanine carboxypeptidase (penicillin-binding protein 5/6)|nr:D-alanyl-D-alanine carboxypeptidase [Treponema sp.]
MKTRKKNMFPDFGDLLFCLLGVFSSLPLSAQEAPILESRAGVLMDAATGTLLYVKNGDEEIPPASLTKLMTIHIALQEIAAGRAALEEIVPLSRESWAINQPPRSSLMFLAAGQRVSLGELLLGLAIPSGNDAAVAVALRFAPRVEEFVGLMNREAREMGLFQTRFVEPSGISEENITTAREFAYFCREYLRLHPESLKNLHSVREFAYPKVSNVGEAYRNRPGTILQSNHNTLLAEGFEGVDGLKTGYIDEAGYNIALTAERRGTRFIAVILGAPAAYRGDRIRDEDGRRLLTWGFDHFKTLRPELGELPAARIWKGQGDYVPILPGESLVFTAPAERGASLRWETEIVEPLTAPLPAGSPVGELILFDQRGELRRFSLITGETMEAGGGLKQLWDSIQLFFTSWGKKDKPRPPSG